jgi:4-amino-4-deoxy-L-arabinose transferase-like glycosyltransferase
MTLELTKTKAFLIVLLVWAGIYLPYLGAPQFKCEEARGVLPAINMLKTGNWIVPVVGGREFHSKPPGINWIIAASFLITGEKSEFTARLPTVVFILIFAAFLIWMPGPWLSLPARFISTLVFLTSVGIMEWGRMIEIEAIYTVMTGIAILWWLNIWSRNGSKWLLWIVPSVVIAYGLLTKGPFIAMFFYCTIFMVLLYNKRIKEFFAVPHLIGIAIMAAVSLGWLHLVFSRSSSPALSRDMTGQFLGHTIFHSFSLMFFVVKIVKALALLFPWLIFMPILWDKNLVERLEPQNRSTFKACRASLIICFLLFNLMPGVQGRYSLPLVPLAAYLLGWVLSIHQGFALSDRVWKNLLLGCFVALPVIAVAGLFVVTAKWPAFMVTAVTICVAIGVFLKRDLLRNVLNLSTATAVVAVLSMLLYAVYGIFFVVRYEIDRPSAYTVNRIVPQGDTVYLFDSRYQTFYFYIRQPFKYLVSEDEIDENVHYLVLEEEILQDLAANHQLSRRSPKILYEFPEKIPTRYRLVKLD